MSDNGSMYRIITGGSLIELEKNANKEFPWRQGGLCYRPCGSITVLNLGGPIVYVQVFVRQG